MLAQSRRRWANIESTLVQRLVFGGTPCKLIVCSDIKANPEKNTRHSRDVGAMLGQRLPTLNQHRVNILSSLGKRTTSRINDLILPSGIPLLPSFLYNRLHYSRSTDTRWWSMSWFNVGPTSPRSSNIRPAKIGLKCVVCREICMKVMRNTIARTCDIHLLIYHKFAADARRYTMLV